MSNNGFLFNGSQLRSGHESEPEAEYDDDSDFEDDDDSVSMSNEPSAAAAVYDSSQHVAPRVPVFRDTSSKLQRSIGLPTLSARRPNSAEEIRDLSMRSELGEGFWEDVDKMLNKRPVCAINLFNML